ncbi:MAG: metallophosphoesterase, partial [Clostridiales bacterium]|nr:metallophosphoesterase [Clostridiales bacterium]
MGGFKWLQFSDLHFSMHDSFDTRMARKALLDFLAKERFTCDYIFFSGDIADKNNYTDAEVYIQKIISNIAHEQVFWAAGNHDIKRGSLLRSNIITQIRSDKDPQKQFEKNMADQEIRVLLTYSGMSDYISQYDQLFGRKLPTDEISAAHIYYPLDHCNLVVLNTCLTSCDDNDPSNLLIAEPRLLEVFDRVSDKSKPLIVIGHHGKDFFHYDEQEKLAKLFEDAGVDIYLCGHSHRLGYARFDAAGRDIPQITCGGGKIDNYSVFSFMLGEYDAGKNTVSITPYSYSDRGSGQFQKDFNLHRRLKEDNNRFILSRLGKPHPETDEPSRPVISLVEEDLFDRSQRYYDFLRSEEGRFSYLKVDEQLFPDIKTFDFDTFLRGESEEKARKLIDILRESPDHMLIVGEGGMGKTTSLLHIWQARLQDRSGELPLYIPLNEYQPQPEFIRSYIKLYYEQIDILALDRQFVLLLDGFNEIPGDTLPLVREIQDLLLKKSDFIRIVMTSRHGFFTEYQMKPFRVYHLQPLDDVAVEYFLQNNSQTADEAPLEVLRTPMMLTLYAQTCSIQKQVRQRNLLDFMPNNKRGELLYNYMLCQIANCVISSRLGEMIPTWYALFAAAPYISHYMESSGAFHIEKEDFARLLSEFTRQYPLEQSVAKMPTQLREMTDRLKLPLEYKIPAEEILVFRQYLLVEEKGCYTFRHQYFRDFFSALHIANLIRDSLATNPFVLPEEVSGRAWLVYVRDLLGDIYGDYQNRAKYCHHTPLHELLGELRGSKGRGSGLAINNILETWRGARENRIIKEDLSRLDLSHVPLHGVVFSRKGDASHFDGSKISNITLLPQGHSFGVNSAVYSADGRRVLSAAADQTIKEWDREKGECLRTYEVHSFEANSAVYSADGQRVLSASLDKTIKEWDRETGECLRTYKGYSTWVNSAVYSADGRRVLSTSFDKTIKEWDRETGECLRTYEGHSFWIKSAVYSADG